MPSPSILCIQIAGARRWRRSARRRSDQARGKETNEKGEKLTVWFCGTKRRVDVDRTNRASADDDEAKTIMDWRTQSERRCIGRSAGERAGTWYRRDTGGWYRFWFYCGNAERSRQLVSPPAGGTTGEPARGGRRAKEGQKKKREKGEKGEKRLAVNV